MCILMYVNFNVFFKFKKVHFLARKLYTYQNSRCNVKKNSLILYFGLSIPTVLYFCLQTDCNDIKFKYYTQNTAVVSLFSLMITLFGGTKEVQADHRISGLPRPEKKFGKLKK